MSAVHEHEAIVRAVTIAALLIPEFQAFEFLEIGRIMIQRRSVTICDFNRTKNIREVKFHVFGIFFFQGKPGRRKKCATFSFGKLWGKKLSDRNGP